MTKSQSSAVKYCLAACREGRAVRINGGFCYIDCENDHAFTVWDQRIQYRPLGDLLAFRPNLISRLRLRWAARIVK
jgi:hypothetical protein